MRILRRIPISFPIEGMEEFQADMFAATLVVCDNNDKEREDVLKQNPESPTCLFQPRDEWGASCVRFDSLPLFASVSREPFQRGRTGMNISATLWLYTRVSSRNQADADYSSLETQRERLEAYCQSQEGYAVYRVYEDGGYSADSLTARHSKRCSAISGKEG